MAPNHTQKCKKQFQTAKKVTMIKQQKNSPGLVSEDVSPADPNSNLFDKEFRIKHLRMHTELKEMMNKTNAFLLPQVRPAAGKVCQAAAARVISPSISCNNHIMACYTQLSPGQPTTLGQQSNHIRHCSNQHYPKTQKSSSKNKKQYNPNQKVAISSGQRMHSLNQCKRHHTIT